MAGTGPGDRPQGLQVERAVLPAVVAALVLSVVLAAASLPAGSVVPPPGSFDPASDEPWPFVRGGPAPGGAAGSPAAGATGSPAAAAAPVQAAKPAASRAARAAPTTRFVRVRKGDTVDALATKAGVSVKTIAHLNPSRDLSSLKPGQYLKLPR